MKNFIKNQKGFTLVELVVVIAIIGILAGMAIPRFLDATASARGAKVVADMRTIQSAEMIYFAKYSKYPTANTDTDFTDLVQGGWPLPPAGNIIVAPTMSNNTNAKPYEGTIASGATYKYTGTGVEPGNLTVTVGSNDVTLTQVLQGTTTTPTP